MTGATFILIYLNGGSEHLVTYAKNLLWLAAGRRRSFPSPPSSVEAIDKLPSPRPPVFASLNCTHYGYSLPLWEAAFAGAGVKPAGLLNPNSRMVDFLFAPGRSGRFPKTAVTIRVVSMVEISPEKIDSLGKRLAQTSPETAASLRTYEFVPGLFRWNSGN